MSDHELASEAHKTTFAGMMSNSRVLSLFCGFVLLLLAALFGVPVPLLALTAIVLVVAFVFMGGSADSHRTPSRSNRAGLASWGAELEPSTAT